MHWYNCYKHVQDDKTACMAECSIRILKFTRSSPANNIRKASQVGLTIHEKYEDPTPCEYVYVWYLFQLYILRQFLFLERLPVGSTFRLPAIALTSILSLSPSSGQFRCGCRRTNSDKNAPLAASQLGSQARGDTAAATAAS